MAQETSARGSKVVSLRDAARLIPDGALITFGGVLLNRRRRRSCASSRGRAGGIFGS